MKTNYPLAADAPDETTILYEISSRLNHSSTTREWLEAVSLYARKRGAAAGYLMWILSEGASAPIQAEIAASWSEDDAPLLAEDAQFELQYFWENIRNGLDALLHQPTLIEDTQTSILVDVFMKDYYAAMQVRAVVLLPQVVKGRWVSVLCFHWRTPTEFDHLDRRIFNTSMQLSASVIETMRLTEQERQRAQLIEQINTINVTLSRARDENEILDAISRYAAQHGAQSTALLFTRCDETGKLVEISYVVEQGQPPTRAAVGHKRLLEDFEVKLLMPDHQPTDHPICFEDHAMDERFDEAYRTDVLSLGIRASVVLPLRNAGIWQALIAAYWSEPHRFSSDEKSVYNAVIPTAASVVARHRAYLETEASEKAATTLFQLAESINAATSYQDIVNSVSAIQPESAGVFLGFFENLNLDQAGYVEIVAHSVKSDVLRPYVRVRVPIVPAIHKFRHDPLWISEDLQNDARFDDETRICYRDLPARAGLVVPLSTSGRLWGLITFYYLEPRTFNEWDRRIALGIGDLVRAAVERIISQQETAAANEELTFLYRLAEHINAATTYQQVVESVAELQPEANGILLNFFEHMDFERAAYFETIAASVPAEAVKLLLKRRTPILPIIAKLRCEKIWISENIYDDPRYDEVSLAIARELMLKAVMIVPLKTGERLWGVLVFNYIHTHEFSEREQRLALGIGDLVIAAVERIRLLQESAAAVEAQRNALVAEQEARLDLSFLYQASEVVNAATTFPEVIKAIAPLVHRNETVNLILWEHLDYRKASYFEVVAGINHRGEISSALGVRNTEAQFPIAKHMARLRQLAIGSIYDHPLVDPITRANWEKDKVGALLLVSLMQEERWYGVLSFESAFPRQYSERDCRLTLAISDLILSAVIRIRAQDELAAAAEAQRSAYLAEQGARQEIGQLYQVSRAINRATTMLEVLEATKQLFPDPIHVSIFAWENYDRSEANYLECIVSTDANLAPGMRLSREVVAGPAALDPAQLLVANDVNSAEWAANPAAHSARLFGLHSIAYANLMYSQRIQGLFAIACYQPYSFNPQEIRLMAATTDLTAAALERFRLRQAEEEARRDREELFRASQAINAASSYQEILRAVSHIAFDDGAFYLYVFENFSESRIGVKRTQQ